MKKDSVVIEQTIQSETLIEYVIDLDRSLRERMESILETEREAACELVEAVMKEFEGCPGLLTDGFETIYQVLDGSFQDELKQWANALDISPGKAAWVNCAYEFSHLGVGISDWLGWINPFGCTTGLCKLENSEMVHVRNLDWPIPRMGEATRLLRYKKGTHEFVSVGFPMFVGVLSGMVPGQYSATINWAPPAGAPDFASDGPAFLLRHVLATCATYEEAVTCLRDTPLFTCVFYTVCGNKAGQACVIERTTDGVVVREVEDGFEAQSNHHVARKFEGNNEILKTSETLVPVHRGAVDSHARSNLENPV